MAKVSTFPVLFQHLKQQSEGEGVRHLHGQFKEIVYKIKDEIQSFSQRQTTATQTLEFAGTRGVTALIKTLGFIAVLSRSNLQTRNK